MSLNTKMAVAVALLFIFFDSAASYFTFSYFEKKFKQTIATQQYSLVSSLADTIDDKLKIAQNALIAVASAAPPDVWTDADAAQRFLDQRIGLQSNFDNGIFFINADGILVAESPYRPGRRGKNLSHREWIQKTVSHKKPYISDPYFSTHTPGQPAVVLTVPIFDKQGTMKGMMTGSFDLLGQNNLAELSKIKIGNTGYLYITDSNRIMIVHPDKSRIMKPAAAPGVNKMYDKAAAGFDGNGETTTSYGIRMLSSFKHLRTTSWILAANYPVAEAYSLLGSAKLYFLIATTLGMFILLIISWFVMRRLILPLSTITRHVKDLPLKRGIDRLAPIKSMDEIGILITAFNSLVETLDKQQDDLKKREEKFRLLADFTSDWEYWIDPDQNIVYSSPSCLTITGYEADMFRQDPGLLSSIIHADDRNVVCCHVAAAMKGEEDHQSADLEFRIVTREGETRWLSHVCRPIFDDNGVYRGRRASNRDITHRKHTEEKLHEQTSLLETEMAERQKAQEILAVKQLQLEALNSSLEARISDAVHEIRQKDQLLIQQGRLVAMGEMLNNIAHQWRQPLNNIGLIIQNMTLAFEQGDLTEKEMKADTRLAMDNILFLSRTIDDFRQFSSSDKRKQGFEVNAVIDKTLDLIAANLKNNNITVDLEVKTEATAHGFPNEYSQVLLNILNNAKDVLLERKVPESYIRIRVSSKAGASVVTIWDNGGGIDDEIRHRIFDPYFSTKEPGLGTGIGLYMSKVIIEKNMSGSLNVRNINGGAEFSIEIPLYEEHTSLHKI